MKKKNNVIFTIEITNDDISHSSGLKGKKLERYIDTNFKAIEEALNNAAMSSLDEYIPLDDDEEEFG